MRGVAKNLSSIEKRKRVVVGKWQQRWALEGGVDRVVDSELRGWRVAPSQILPVISAESAPHR